MLRNMIIKNRSYRRFVEDARIESKTLESLVDLARLSATGGNKQALKFLIANDVETNSRIFPSLAWAGYLTDWNGPAEGERPSAYIVILGDKEVAGDFGCDHGIAAQSMLLGAAERGLGGCMIGSIRRRELAESLSLEPRYEILLVLAIGTPAEEVVLEDVGSDGDIKYWRDSNGVHHVPKRSLAQLIVEAG